MPISQSDSVAAEGGVLEWVHLLVGAEPGKAVFDGLAGHRLQPQPFEGLVADGGVPDILDDVFEDQLAFAAGIAGVDDLDDVLAADEFLQGVQLSLGVWEFLEGKFFRQDRELGDIPFLIGGIDFFGVADRNQVADGEGHDMPIPFVMGLGLGELAGQNLDDVCCDAGLFGDDEDFFSHEQACGSGWLRIVGYRVSCWPNEIELEYTIYRFRLDSRKRC